LITQERQQPGQPGRYYRFTHDRIQQTVYDLIPADGVRYIHWQLGEALLARLRERLGRELRGKNGASG
jgi:predicted ATPase